MNDLDLKINNGGYEEKKEKIRYYLMQSIIFCLFYIVGSCSWILVNSLFLETPFLISSTPEGYGIVSWLIICVQFGNLFGFICAFFQAIRSIKPKYMLAGVLIFALITDILVTQIWDWKVVISEKERSIGLIIIFIFSGGVGSMSVITMFPYVSQYKPIYISVLSTGMGSVAIFLSLLSALQNSGKVAPNSMRFGFEAFFYIILGFFPLALISMGLLEYVFHDFIINPKHPITNVDHNDNQNSVIHVPLNTQNNEQVELIFFQDNLVPNESPHRAKHSYYDICYIIKKPLASQLYINLMYYLIFGVSPYSLVGYSQNKIEEENLLFYLSLFNVLGGCIGRLMTIIFHFKWMRMLTVMQVICFSALTILCFISHIGISLFWAWTTIVLYGLYSAIYGYEDTMNYIEASQLLERNKEKSSSSLLVGATNQVGSAIGSVISFLLTMYYFQT